MRIVLIVFSVMLGFALFSFGCQSKSDQAKSERGKDNSAILLTPAQLQSFFSKNAISTVFLLSTSDCENCKQTETFLSHLSATPQALFVLKKINFLEKGEQGNKADLNVKNSKEAMEAFPKNWTGKFPAIFISNPMQNISMLFEGPFTNEELEAILTPVTI
ncbi:MAG: hypothetical protein R2879_08985 [Saprospiraceae bacterium]